MTPLIHASATVSRAVPSSTVVAVSAERRLLRSAFRAAS